MANVKVYKTTVNLPDSSMATLEALAARRGKTMSQIIREAIETERVLQETVDNGGKVLLKERDDTLKQLIIR
jgi:predicted DNA-binding protein